VPPRSETHATYGFPDEAARTEEHFPQLAADDPPAPSCSLIQRHCALAESFNASLKVERVHRAVYPTREKARQDVARYIELRYNRTRLHSALGYRTPQEVHDEYLNWQRAA
jgi:transposase InsO family protein